MFLISYKDRYNVQLSIVLNFQSPLYLSLVNYRQSLIIYFYYTIIINDKLSQSQLGI